MTRLIIARHGNTFEEGETPRRVGLRTDLPLAEKGWEQARILGRYLRDNDLLPAAIFTSYLQRTINTARIAAIEAGLNMFIQKEAIFNEIDYGPDENKTEEDVVARIGQEALDNWNKDAAVPPGWNVHPQEIINNWLSFGERVSEDYKGCNILVVTSNGVARFAPYLTGAFDEFSAANDIKISTGALCILENPDGHWKVTGWNIKP